MPKYPFFFFWYSLHFSTPNASALKLEKKPSIEFTLYSTDACPFVLKLSLVSL